MWERSYESYKQGARVELVEVTMIFTSSPSSRESWAIGPIKQRRQEVVIGVRREYKTMVQDEADGSFDRGKGTMDPMKGEILKIKNLF